MLQVQKPLKVIKLIGEGLNASVYMVEKRLPNLNTEHIFALKVLKNAASLKVFKLEFETLLRAHGKHLVRYCGVESFKGQPALLLEHIDGVTLHELFYAQKLSQEEIMWIGQEALAGLKELSYCGLFHGDLSLKNIMLQSDGNLKLIDFGLSHWSTKQIELTPEFADPKLFNGAKPDLESDIFALKKIISKISHSSLELCPDSIATKPPASLADKIHLLAQPHQQTARIGIHCNRNRKRHTKSYLTWLVLSSLFLTPASALNSLQTTRPYQIRSKSWLHVTGPDGTSCYTPCSLQLKEQTVETLKWKTQDKSGRINVYTETNKVISIEI